MEHDAYLAILAQIADNAPASITVHDFSGAFLYANEATFRLHGYTREEFMQKNLREIDAPESAGHIAERMEQIRREGEAEFEVSHVRKDGSEVPLHVLVKIVKWGETDVLLSIATDVTERRRADEALREREELLNTTQELSKVGGWVWDVAAQRMSWTKETYRIHDIDPGAIPPGSPDHITLSLACYDEKDRERIRESFRACANAGIPYDLEVRFTSVAGRRLWVRTFGRPVFEEGRAVRVVGIIMDITDRKQGEEALRQSEERYRLIAENTADYIWIFDMDLNLTYISPAVRKIRGYSAEEAIAQPLDQVLTPESLGRTLFFFREELAREASGDAEPGRRRVFETEEFRRDGSTVFIENTVTFLRDTSGIPTGILGISRDITDRKRSDQVRESLMQELSAKNQELERFTYTVSHDLKSPLVTIRGFLGFLEEDAASGDLTRLREDISRIDSATEKIQQLIDALLELSRIGRIANPREWISLSEIAHEAADLLEGPIQARGVVVSIEPDLPEVYADRPRLREVFSNLIENAVKFMGDQPEPSIRVESRGEEEGGAVVCIRDNGIGIDPADHDRIFSLFSKLDPVTPGSGIGLSLVRRIIDVHGGRIWLESEGTGRGSTFCFTFPKRSRARSPGPGEELKY